MNIRSIGSGLLGCLTVACGWVGYAHGGEESAPSATIYTKDNAPAAPKAEDLEARDTVSQYGITWTFDKKASVGKFVNGDYYVVGAVTVTAIDPKPLFGAEVPDSEVDSYEKKKNYPVDQRLRNGSTLNPPAAQRVAYDSGVKNYYNPTLASKLPIAMKPGDSLVSSISLKLNEGASFAYHSSGKRTAGDNSPIKVAAVLTCVAEAQPADAFRPAFCDRTQKIYLTRNLRRELLPKLERTKGAPDPVKFSRAFQKPWLNTGFFGFEEPMENMPHYGQWVGEAVGDAALILCMDFKPEEKEPLLINFIQVGIDYWGMVRSGHPGWQAWGGHGSGRKLPIVFGGYLLGDEEMMTPTKAFPKVEFGEDNQTRYGECWSGAKVVFAGHSGIQTNGNKVNRAQWGPYEHLPPSDWKKGGLNGTQSEAYRRANTSRCWPAQALTLRIMKLEKYWAHDPFLDYVDRWMYENDKEHRKEIAKYHQRIVNPDDDNNFANQGQTGEGWVKIAWDAYRTMPGMPPTDGWKQVKEGPRINAADFPVKESPDAEKKKPEDKKGAETPAE